MLGTTSNQSQVLADPHHYLAQFSGRRGAIANPKLWLSCILIWRNEVRRVLCRARNALTGRDLVYSRTPAQNFLA